jgi:hypothetical protein
MIVSHIEDIVDYICDCPPIIKSFDLRDKTILSSIRSQLQKNIALTSSQTNLIVKIISQKKHLFNDVINYDDIINNPVTRFPFRIVNNTKSIKYKDGKLFLKFPFNKNIIEIIRKITSTEIHYNPQTKEYELPYSEYFCLHLCNKLIPNGFTIDKPIEDAYEQLKKILEHPFNYLPSFDIVDNKITLFNVPQIVQKHYDENKTDKLLPNIFLARRILQLTPTPSALEYIENLDMPYLTHILKQQTNKFAVTEIDTTKKCKILNLANQLNSLPILIKVNDDEILEKEFNEWIFAFTEAQIDFKKISVLFRSNNPKNKVNKLISKHKLNNYLDETTQIAIISARRPKILFRLNFKPLLQISYVNNVVLNGPAIIHCTHYGNIGKVANYTMNSTLPELQLGNVT